MVLGTLVTLRFFEEAPVICCPPALGRCPCSLVIFQLEFYRYVYLLELESRSVFLLLTYFNSLTDHEASPPKVLFAVSMSEEGG